MEDKPLSRELFDKIYSKVPRLCVDLIIKNNDGILLTKRAISPYFGEWHFPGGTVFFKETIEQAAKRIAKRELGVDIKLETQLGYMEFTEEDSGRKHSVLIVFLANISRGEITLNEESSAFLFTKTVPEKTVAHHKDFFNQKLTLLV